jgi:hypothetical protein
MTSAAASRTVLLAPAFASAGVAVSAVGLTVAAHAAAAAAPGQPAAGLLLAPLVAAALAMLAGLLGVLPGVTWALAASLIGPHLLARGSRALKGVLVGLICAGPTVLVSYWISGLPLLGGLQTPMMAASLVGGIAAGLILAWMAPKPG